MRPAGHGWLCPGPEPTSELSLAQLSCVAQKKKKHQELLFALKLLTSAAHRRGKNHYLTTFYLPFLTCSGWKSRLSMTFICVKLKPELWCMDFVSCVLGTQRSLLPLWFFSCCNFMRRGRTELSGQRRSTDLQIFIFCPCCSEFGLL